MTDTIADLLAELTTETREAWHGFLEAVHDGSGGQVLDAYRAYWRLRRDALAEYGRNPWAPGWTPPPAPPQLVGDEHSLRAERDWLRGHAQANATGIVPGRATATVGTDTSREYTAEERAEYACRAAAYPAALGAWNESVRAYERHYNRESWTPGGPDQWGFSSPAASPSAPPPQQERPRRAAPALPGVDDFNRALAIALTEEN